MGDFRCPKCTRSLARVRAWIWGRSRISFVVGTCRRHGREQAVGKFGLRDFLPEHMIEKEGKA